MQVSITYPTRGTTDIIDVDVEDGESLTEAVIARGDALDEWVLTPGAYGIEAVSPCTEGAMVCGECGRAWVEDITPAGRCPWEWDHDTDEEV